MEKAAVIVEYRARVVRRGEVELVFVGIRLDPKIGAVEVAGRVESAPRPLRLLLEDAAVAAGRLDTAD